MKIILNKQNLLKTDIFFCLKHAINIVFKKHIIFVKKI